ncbi:MAG: DUF4199 domain-containing protein [Bacteroidota bacterium]
MKKQTYILFGLFAGFINIAGWFVLKALFQKENTDFGLGEILGYAVMLLALSTVFFGVKRYRDRQLNGKITFVQALFNGLGIVLIASVIYVVGWEIYYPNFASGFEEQYTTYIVNTMEAEGHSKDEIQAQKEEMAVWIEKYKSPFYRIPSTFTEILPPGILIALITALLLKKK